MDKRIVGYRVGQEYFNNPFTAFLYGAHNDIHSHPEFCIFEDFFSKIDWTIEPSQSVQELVDGRAKQLREKYNKIILTLSGGTDSQTIYNSFRRCNIKIDMIILSYTNAHVSYHPKQNANWLIDNHNDPETKLVIFDRNDPRFLDVYCRNEWTTEDKGTLAKFNLTAQDWFYKFCAESYENDNWCLVMGLDKPHIIRENNKWYAVHLDKVYKSTMGLPRIEFFYVSPDYPFLHIKQNHTLLKYIKQTYKNFYNGWNSSAICGSQDIQDYENYAAACGLDSELTKGQGWSQKTYDNWFNMKDAFSLVNNRFDQMKNIDPILKERLLNKDKNAQTFIDAWQGLQTDKTLIDYMYRHSILSKPNQVVDGYNGLWGKRYLLAEN